MFRLRSLYFSSPPTEPDPPKTFSVVFVNITSALVKWTAYRCNGLIKPGALLVRYKQEANDTWVERRYDDPDKELLIARQFQHGAAYLFSSRLVYDNRVGVYSNTLKIFPPGKFFFNIMILTWTIDKIDNR